MKTIVIFVTAIISLRAVIYCEGDGFKYRLQEPFWYTSDPDEVPKIEWAEYIVIFKTWQEAKEQFWKDRYNQQEGHSGGLLREEGYVWTVDYDTDCKKGMM